MSSVSSEKIGLSTATIVGMNAMIGAGIFAIPSALAGKVGPAGILSFAFVAVAVWFLAQSFARISQLFPQEGSFYIYAYQWGGHITGLIASGSYLIGLFIAMGLLTQAAGQHLVHYAPQFSDYNLGLVTLVTLTVLNMRGVSLSSLGQKILIVCTVFPLVATTVVCLTKANVANLVPFAPLGTLNIFKATRIVAFAFFGFESSASLFNIIKDPEKNLPRAVSYSLACVAILYLAFVFALILAVPLDLFSQFPGPIAKPLSVIFPDSRWIIEAIHFSSISAILGTLHSMIWSAGFLLLTFLKKLQTPQIKQLVASKHMSASTTTGLVGLCIFLTFITFENTMFFNFTALFLLLAYSLSIVPLLTIKNEWETGRNYITLAGLGAAICMCVFAVQSILGY